MSEEAPRILLMRRPSLNSAEVRQLYSALTWADSFKWRFKNPSSEEEWFAACKEINPDYVILPDEQPLQMKAVEAGFKHIAFTPNGPQRFLGVTTKFGSM